jgi:hypothetical protein
MGGCAYAREPMRDRTNPRKASASSRNRRRQGRTHAINGRVQPSAARVTCGRECCFAPLPRYLESHDLRCSSKNARTCSGSSAPKNSTPTGSGSGLKTLSGVGIFGGLASMIFSPLRTDYLPRFPFYTSASCDTWAVCCFNGTRIQELKMVK